jgi:asparagine synthase (glutamine-hydrolysing)
LSKDSGKAISILESRFYMGNMLLRDSDVFGMAHGLEIRVPLLDKNLVEYVMALPGKWCVGQKKYNKPLLADALYNRLPQDVHRLPKRGFNLSQANWMAGPLRERFEQYITILCSSGLMEPDAVSGVWQDFIEDKQGPT